MILITCAAYNSSHELSAIDRSSVVFREDAVVFQLKEGFLLKNKSQLNAPSMLSILTLPNSPLFPVRALRGYLADTFA